MSINAVEFIHSAHHSKIVLRQYLEIIIEDFKNTPL